MPFTFSHPAVVLPFTFIRSGYISASCLIAGSITPDFEYFLTMKLTGRFSHTWQGAFLFDLPVGIVLVLLFHSIVKRPLINSLPTYVHSRLTYLRDFDFIAMAKRYWPGYLLCLLLGIFSHILWDSFTHANSFFVRQTPFLSKPVDSSFLPSWPLFRYLQHASTLVGAVIIVYLFHKQKTVFIKTRWRWDYWSVVIVVLLAALSIRTAIGFEYFGDVVASLISSLVLGLFVASLIFRHRYSSKSIS